RDFLYLTTPELAGLVRGSGVDADGKPTVAARKRQAAQRPLGLPRRVETKGVVATSLLNDDDDDEPQVTSPGDAKELSGRSVSSGLVNEPSVLLDGNPLKPGKAAVPGGAVVDAPQATGAFQDGEPLFVDGGKGTVKRVVKMPPAIRPLPAAAEVDPH